MRGGEVAEKPSNGRQAGEIGSRPALEDDGRIPFRIRVGVTGHREIAVDRREAVHRALDRFQDRLLGGSLGGGSPVTDVQLAIVSELAEGGDRIVVRHVFEYAAARGQEARLEVVLPMEKDQYAEIQGFDDGSRRELDDLLEASTFHVDPPRAELKTHDERADAYVAAGKKVTARCDVLIALWDGKHASGKRGGTAHTLLNAAAQGRPCIWIPVEGDGETRDNLDEGSSRSFFEEVKALSATEPDYRFAPAALDGWSLNELSEVFRVLDEYNREPRPRALAHPSRGRLGRIATRLSDRAFDWRSESGFQRDLEEETGARLVAGSPRWLVAPSARASLLAAHYRRWFKRLSTFVLISASLAAASLAVGIGTGTETWLWGTLEFGFLMLTLIAFVVLREFGFHSRWLSYRVLAERFRTARYLAPTGIDFREQARVQGVWVGGRSEEWLMRAFEEVWDREPHEPRISVGELEPIKRLLADEWVQGQIDYHERAKKEHERLKRRLTVTVYLAFGLTLVFAALDATLAGLGGSHEMQNVSKALTIFLPVLGASVGAALTINQHHALAERSAQMQADLRLVQADLAAATDTHILLEAAIAAARVIAPETGTWFGALWFLDIEHP